MFFSVITKNLNWEILNKNSATCKNGIGLRRKNVNDMGVGLNKNPMFRGGLSQKKQCSGGNCLKKGASTFGRFKVELAKKRGGGGGSVFEGGLIP